MIDDAVRIGDLPGQIQQTIGDTTKAPESPALLKVKRF
jgi:hypothetical protein